MQINIFYKTQMPKYYRASGRYKAAVLSSLGKTAAKPGEVNIIFVGNSEMLRINKQFLGHNYTTDVISFNYPYKPANGMPFGDIFVCFPQAKKQAEHGTLKELLILTAHGALHLVGHKDDTDKLRGAMNKKAQQIAEEVL